MQIISIPQNEQLVFSQESAAHLVNFLSRFDASIMIHDGNRTINAKSLLGLLSLGYLQSGALEFTIDGYDEQAALEAIRHYFSR